MVKHKYLPNSDQDRKEMLEVIGANSIEDLFSDIPQAVWTEDLMAIPSSLSEFELLKHTKKLAAKNINANEIPYFLGAGTYDHYIPAVVNAIIQRQEFLTAYVPYQPEISQGELQALYEWQTMVTRLTGMDVTNSGMYDGYNALVEAANLAHGYVKKSNKVLVSKAINPQGIQNLKTYGFSNEYAVEEIALENDITSLSDLEAKLDNGVAAVIVQYPNFFGSVEDLQAIKDVLKDSKTLLIVSSNPMALAKLEAPGNLGADIVVGDMQPFGIAMSYGGPHCGYLATTEKLMRKLPSRIVGRTVDADGKRGFVMTLTTREQHIRREKATSNYSSNQALFALASAVALTAYGKEGAQELAQQNINKAHYLATEIKNAGFEVLNANPFYNEFLVQLPSSVKVINEKLLEKGFMGGYDASEAYGKDNIVLLCATEKRTKEEIDGFIQALSEVAK